MSKRQYFPSPDWLKQHYIYHPRTGAIYDRHRRKRADEQSGAYRLIRPKGYAPILAHRAAVALQTGQWPHTVDHRNTCGNDNRWSNLRATDALGNARNPHTLPKGGYRFTPTTTADGNVTGWRIWATRKAKRATRDARVPTYCQAWHTWVQWQFSDAAVAAGRRAEAEGRPVIYVHGRPYADPGDIEEGPEP